MPLLDSGSRPIVSYTRSELACGNGTIDVWLAKGNTTNMIIPTKGYTGPRYYEFANASTTIDHDFDMLLNKPLTLFGKTIVGIPVRSVNPATFNLYAQVYIRKWDGASETEIANGQSQTISFTADAYWMMGCPVDITTETTIKAGEYLRVTIKLINVTISGTGNIRYACDPMGQSMQNIWDATTLTSELLVPLPVRIRI